MSDELATEADPQGWHRAQGRFDQGQLIVFGRKLFVHAHRAAHDDERRVPREGGQGVGLPQPDEVAVDVAVPRVVGDVAVALVRNVLEHEHAAHPSAYYY